MLKKIFYELNHFRHKADVVGGMRVSISFDSERDSAYFQEEIRRELRDEILTTKSFLDVREFEIYGIKVRIL